MKLELRGITKRFGALVANDQINLSVESGEIHGLLGENGAGKSTLMNVLYGLLRPDAGEIMVDDEPVACNNPAQAMALGIGMVHQHFMLVPVFTVAENVMLGHESLTGLGLLDLDTARRQVREISEKYGFAVDPDAVVEDLPVGIQQRVEIIKALVRRADMLILDEPTAVLTPQETDELIGIMRQLKDDGTSIVFITHKLREVRAVADHITVLRRGSVVGTVEPTATDADLAAMMVGRSVVLRVDKRPATPEAPVLVVEELTVRDQRGQTVVDDVSLEVRGGEILAVAGVQGNGQTELAEALLGLQAGVTGSVRLDERELVGLRTHRILNAGVGFVPEDRSVDGLVDSFSVAENLVLDRYTEPAFAKGLGLRLGAIRDNAARLIDEFDIRTQRSEAAASTLSGGNQQKVVVAREMSRPLRLLIAAQPTRGVDVGSIEFIHQRIIAERDRGTAVLIVSTELDEVSALADRIAVMYRGALVGVVDGDTSNDVLGLMMAGVPAGRAREEAVAHPTETELGEGTP